MAETTNYLPPADPKLFRMSGRDLKQFAASKDGPAAAARAELDRRARNRAARRGR